MHTKTIRTSQYAAWLMFVLTALFYFYDFLLRSIPSVLRDQIATEFQLTAANSGFLEAAFYYTYTPMQLLAGPLIDEYGCSRILPFAVACCLIGSLLSALHFGFALLLFARLLIGLGSAFAFITVLKTINDWLPIYYYAPLVGTTTTLGMLGGVIAQEYLPEVAALGDNLMYTISAIICLLFIVSSYCIMVDKEPHHDDNVDSTTLLNDIYSIIKRPQTWLIGSIGCVLFSPIQLFAFWAKSFFIQAYLLSPLAAARSVEMLFWGVACGAPLFGWASSAFSCRQRLLCGGSLLSAVVFAVIIFIPGTPTPISAIVPSALMLLLGLTMSVQPLVFVYAKEVHTAHLAATAFATVNMIINLSAYVQPIIGGILDSYKQDTFSHYSVTAWQVALSPVLIALILCTIACYYLPKETSGDS